MSREKPKYKYYFEASGYAHTDGYVRADNIEEAKKKAHAAAHYELETIDDLDVRRAKAYE